MSTAYKELANFLAEIESDPCKSRSDDLKRQQPRPRIGVRVRGSLECQKQADQTEDREQEVAESNHKDLQER